MPHTLRRSATHILLPLAVGLAITIAASAAVANPDRVEVPFEGSAFAATLHVPEHDHAANAAAVWLNPLSNIEGAHALESWLHVGISVLALDAWPTTPDAPAGPITPESSIAQVDRRAAAAVAGAEFLRSRDGFDSSNVGLVGSFDAGWIAPRASELDPSLAFTIIRSGSALSVGQTRHHDSLDTPEPMSRQSVAFSPELAAFDGVHGYAPRSDIEQTTTPLLYVLGGRDTQTPAASTLATIAAIQNAGRVNLDAEVLTLADDSLANTMGTWNYDPAAVERAWLAHIGVIDPDKGVHWFALPHGPIKPGTDEAAILQSVVDFAVALDTSDRDLYDPLFLNGKITYATPFIHPATGQLFTLDAEGFFDRVVAPSGGFQERFRNIIIHIDAGKLATMESDFVSGASGFAENFGRERWSLVRSPDGWKITSVDWTMSMVRPSP